MSCLPTERIGRVCRFLLAISKVFGIVPEGNRKGVQCNCAPVTKAELHIIDSNGQSSIKKYKAHTG